MLCPVSTLYSEASDEDLRGISESFADTPPEVLLRWSLEEFGEEVALATGFGVEGCVLVDILARIDRRARIFYLDTDLLFPETYALRDQLAARYGVRFERHATQLSVDAQAAQYGPELWKREPNECCRLRKVEPLKRALEGLSAWITAIRRDQSPARAGVGLVERDRKFGLVKINPLAGWSSRDVWDYVVKHDIPYNPLHNENYSSIGCQPCTTPIRIGEDPRTGRWRGTAKTECGLHG